MSSAPRPAAPRQAKPAQRYFRGKALPGTVAQDPSDSEEEDDDENGAQFQGEDIPLGGDLDEEDEEEDDGGAVIPTSTRRPHAGGAGAGAAKGMNVALRNVNIQDGKVLVDGRAEVGRTEMEESSGEEEEDEDGRPPGIPGQAQEEESSSEYESDSEEEEQPKVMLRPVFVPKRNRVTVQERELEAQNTEAATAKREEEAEKRKKESHDLVAESIKRELAEKDAQEVVLDLDDTDGVDPAAEFEEWRLRELSRIKRDKEAQLQREQEREEIERRRAMPEEQRLAEDLEHAKKLREEKPKGQQKFLQKYYHKGAFHQELDVLKRDYTEATESTVDISILPKVMQVKNFGKRSRTKYTHLLDQDTSREQKLAGTGSQPKDGGGCFNCGGPHLARDCPSKDQPGQSGQHTSGANNAQGSGPKKQWGVGSRSTGMGPPASSSSRRPERDQEDGDRERSRNGDRDWRGDQGPRDRDDRDRMDRGDSGDRERYRKDDAYDDRRRDERRRYSRSPPRGSRRSRSPPPGRGDDRRDKDRRVEDSGRRRHSRSRSGSRERYDKRRRRD